MRRSSLNILFCTVLAIIVTTMLPGCSGDNNSTPAGPAGTWSWEAVGSGVNNRVFSFAEYNGDLYVGGYFDSAGGTQAANFALWNDSSWKNPLSQYSIPQLNNEVAALVEYGGRLAVGGAFTSMSGLSMPHFLFWDGASVDHVPGSFNGRIYAMCVYDSLLIIGGDFSENDGGAAGANNIVAYNYSTSQWSAMDTGTDGPVQALTVYDGKLYAGGHFVHAGGAIVNNIAVWYDSAQAWGPLLTGVTYPADTAHAAVFALAEYSNRLYVGGEFSAAGSSNSRNIASFAPFGWQACGTGTNSPLDPVRALAAFDNKLVAGGYFTGMGYATNTNGIAAWNGSAWSALGEGINGDYYPHVWALYVHNNKLYAGGRFTIAGTDSTCGNIACWSFTAK